MTKQSLFPFYAETLRSIRGVEVLDAGGAAMMHFSDVDSERAQDLKYPCRIDAVIMLICVRGEISLSSHMGDYTLKANQLFISSASVFQFHSVTGSEFYMLAFSSDFFAKMNVDIRLIARMVSQLHTSAHIVKIGDENIRGVVRFFDAMYTDHSTKEMNEYAENALSHLFCAIIYRICDLLLDKEHSVTLGVKERSSEYFEKLMTLLSEHYREQRNVEFYAEKMHISSKHLSRVIRNFTGKSVHQWIDEFVALEIKNLLKYSNMSIQQISYSLNFPNPSFMGQYFKRITGLTPGEYKKS